MRLSAVETLGATTVILTDKTGTLTENRMRLQEIDCGEITFAISSPILRFQSNRSAEGIDSEACLTTILTAVMLCNNAELSDDERLVGDPLEQALLAADVAE